MNLVCLFSALQVYLQGTVQLMARRRASSRGCHETSFFHFIVLLEVITCVCLKLNLCRVGFSEITTAVMCTFVFHSVCFRFLHAFV